MNDVENFDDLKNICFMVYAIETSLVYSIKKDTYDFIQNNLLYVLKTDYL